MRFAAEPRRRRGPGLTPLIDVVFLLLLFFMLASRFERESHLPVSVRVSAEASGSAPGATDDSVLRVRLDAAGRARLDGRTVDEGTLAEAVAAAARADRRVRIRPDPETPLQPLVDALGLVRDAGARDVELERSPGPGEGD